MAFSVSSLMSGIMANPDVLITGLVAGFVIAKFMGRRKNQFGGGGMI